LISEPPETLSEIARFLDIPTEFRIDSQTEKVNAAHRPGEDEEGWTDEVQNMLGNIARGPITEDITFLSRDWPDIAIQHWSTYLDLLDS
jgi:hypothetical protein